MIQHKNFMMPRYQVITGQPEVNKMVALSKIKGLFPGNPFVAGFGNKVSFIINLFLHE